MSGDHFTGGAMPHEPVRRLPDDLYEDVEKNIVYACTDVALRNPETGELFLGSRQIEPQIGPWFVGGRDAYGKGIDENAALQVKNDLGLDIDQTRFANVATYSTDFPIASPGREDHGRHTQNAVMLVDLKPDEVEALNNKVASGEIRDEYSAGAWYRPSDIADPESDFPWALKQFVRDMYAHDIARVAIHEDALNEYEVRERIAEEERQEQAERERIAGLTVAFGMSEHDAVLLERQGGVNTGYSVAWARRAADVLGSETTPKLEAILADKSYGDVQLTRELKKLGLTRPEITSDNGPVLRAILKAAVLALKFNEESKGALFKKAELLENLARSFDNPVTP